MAKLDPNIIRQTQIYETIENPNMEKDEKIHEVHKILCKSDNELLDDYFYEQLEKKIFNFEETYSSLFKGRDKDENKKNK